MGSNINLYDKIESSETLMGHSSMNDISLKNNNISLTPLNDGMVNLTPLPNSSPLPAASPLPVSSPMYNDNINQSSEIQATSMKMSSPDGISLTPLPTTSPYEHMDHNDNDEDQNEIPSSVIIPDNLMPSPFPDNNVSTPIDISTPIPISPSPPEQDTTSHNDNNIENEKVETLTPSYLLGQPITPEISLDTPEPNSGNVASDMADLNELME